MLLYLSAIQCIVRYELNVSIDMFQSLWRHHVLRQSVVHLSGVVVDMLHHLLLLSNCIFVSHG